MVRLHPMAVFGLLKEFRGVTSDQGPIVIAGPRLLVETLRGELARDGEPGAVKVGAIDGATALVLVLAAPPAEEDERLLKQAHRKRIPIVCVLAGPEAEGGRIPFVLATDIVRVPAGSGFPIDEIARSLARRLGDDGTSLAARLPRLRQAVSDELIRTFSRKAGLLGVAVFVPGADLPALTLLQLRLVLRIGAAHGVEINRERLPEILAVIGSGLAFRAAARQTLGFIPVAGWLLKGAIAYAGTKALGEAAVRYFATRAA